MFYKLKNLIPLNHPLRLFYHKIRAIFANILYGFPSQGMVIIGVTGTNGKTTTCNIIAKGLRKAGKKIFLFSTINIIINEHEEINTTKMTSPDVFQLQRLLKIAHKSGCEFAIIETASHGILMNRIWGLDYDILVLTNITQDHLDLHGNMMDYVQTKLSIFKKLIRYKRKPGVKKIAIINKNSEYVDLFLAETYDTMLTYGNSYDANIKYSNVVVDTNGMKFNVHIAGGNYTIHTSLRGDFNVENILAAIGVFVSLGIPRKDIQTFIQNISPIPGRMEEIQNTIGCKIFVDYAHTPDALKKAFIALKKIKGINRIITVFGATGDRDRTKRAIMGKEVSHFSDIIILTQDDDYNESTQNIIKDVVKGIQRNEGENFWIIPDRKEAIRYALLSGEKKDIIFIAGKGDEHTMITNQGTINWHDKSIVQELLFEINENKF